MEDHKVSGKSSWYASSSGYCFVFPVTDEENFNWLHKRDVQAGGPGSGRHKEIGDMTKIAKKAGYTLRKKAESFTSFNGPKGQLLIIRHAGPNWEHHSMSPKKSELDEGETSHGLRNFFLGTKDVKAGGPGSGCHGDNCGRPAIGGKKGLKYDKVGHWVPSGPNTTKVFKALQEKGKVNPKKVLPPNKWNLIPKVQTKIQKAANEFGWKLKINNKSWSLKFDQGGKKAAAAPEEITKTKLSGKVSRDAVNAAVKQHAKEVGGYKNLVMMKPQAWPPPDPQVVKQNWKNLLSLYKKFGMTEQDLIAHRDRVNHWVGASSKSFAAVAQKAVYAQAIGDNKAKAMAIEKAITEGILRKKYGDSVTLYRGVCCQYAAKAEEKIMQASSVTLKTRGADSWSLSKGVAKGFGSTLLSMKVPVGSVATSFISNKYFIQGEKEFVVAFPKNSFTLKSNQITPKKSYYASGEKIVELVWSLDHPDGGHPIELSDDENAMWLHKKSISAGGPGSGCHGDNCGRPSGGKQFDSDYEKGHTQQGTKQGSKWQERKAPALPSGIKAKPVETEGTKHKGPKGLPAIIPHKGPKVADALITKESKKMSDELHQKQVAEAHKNLAWKNSLGNKGAERAVISREKNYTPSRMIYQGREIKTDEYKQLSKEERAQVKKQGGYSTYENQKLATPGAPKFDVSDKVKTLVPVKGYDEANTTTRNYQPGTKMTIEKVDPGTPHMYEVHTPHGDTVHLREDELELHKAYAPKEGQHGYIEPSGRPKGSKEMVPGSGKPYYVGKPTGVSKGLTSPKVTVPDGKLWPEQAYWKGGKPVADAHDLKGRFQLSQKPIGQFQLANYKPNAFVTTTIFEAKRDRPEERFKKNEGTGTTVIIDHNKIAGTGRVVEMSHDKYGNVYKDGMKTVKFSTPLALKSFLKQRYGL